MFLADRNGDSYPNAYSNPDSNSDCHPNSYSNPDSNSDCHPNTSSSLSPPTHRLSDYGGDGK